MFGIIALEDLQYLNYNSFRRRIITRSKILDKTSMVYVFFTATRFLKWINMKKT